MSDFFQKLRVFVTDPTQSRTMGMIIILFLIGAISLTLIVGQQRQQIKQRAATIPPPIACRNIDSIPTCTSSDPANNSCGSKGSQCKIGNTVYECQEE